MDVGTNWINNILSTSALFVYNSCPVTLSQFGRPDSTWFEHDSASSHSSHSWISQRVFLSQDPKIAACHHDLLADREFSWPLLPRLAVLALAMPSDFPDLLMSRLDWQVNANFPVDQCSNQHSSPSWTSLSLILVMDGWNSFCPWLGWTPNSYEPWGFVKRASLTKSFKYDFDFPARIGLPAGPHFTANRIYATVP